MATAYGGTRSLRTRPRGGCPALSARDGTVRDADRTTPGTGLGRHRSAGLSPTTGAPDRVRDAVGVGPRGVREVAPIDLRWSGVRPSARGGGALPPAEPAATVAGGVEIQPPSAPCHPGRNRPGDRLRAVPSPCFAGRLAHGRGSGVHRERDRTAP